MFNKQELLKNVKDSSEKILYAKALDKALYTLKCFEPSFSDFFDPYKVSNLISLMGNMGLNTMVYGGYENSERCMIGFFPEYMEPEYEKFPIAIVEIRYNGQYSRVLSHRDFLGSILGLGLNRDKVGDILLEDERALVFLDESIADYVCVNLERVGRTKVNVKISDSSILKDNTENVTEKKITVASLRLDGVLSGVFNLSRGKIADLIKGEKAFVNWNMTVNGAKTLSEGDVITLRGIGRVKITEICGKTKKDRFLIDVSVYK